MHQHSLPLVLLCNKYRQDTEEMPMATSSKYLENFSASNVAELMINFRSSRNLATSFTNPNRISVCKVLSC
ncbi:hypothetical protein ACHAXS_005601, partial [Conticribra weissflogii]